MTYHSWPPSLMLWSLFSQNRTRHISTPTKATTASRPRKKSSRTATPQGSAGKSAVAGGPGKTGAGWLKLPTLGSTGSESFWSGMRSSQIVMRHYYTWQPPSSAGEKCCLFTDKLLMPVPATPSPWRATLPTAVVRMAAWKRPGRAPSFLTAPPRATPAPPRSREAPSRCR